MVMLGSAYYAIYTSPSLPPIGDFFARISILTAATIGTASCGYVLNDLTDIKQDRRTGRQNIMAGHGRYSRALIIVIVMLLGILPWAWLPWSPLILTLLVLEYGLFLAYSVSPVRLKTRGLLGPIADALYAYVIPGIIAALIGVEGKASSALMLYIIIYTVWAFLFGLLGILRHQLFDHSRDQLDGVNTYIVNHGWACGFDTTYRLAKMVVPATLLLVLVQSMSNPIVVLCFGCHVGWQFWDQKRKALNASKHAELMSRIESFHFIYDRLVGEFCWYWQPLLMLTLIALRSPEYLLMLVIHTVLLPNGIRRMARSRA